MEITRYDVTRFVSEEEIDQEFTGQWVLVSLKGLDNSWDGGYLVPKYGRMLKQTFT